MRPTKAGDQGFIYLIHASTEHFKIGLSANPEARLRVFSVQMPIDVQLLHAFETVNMKDAERRLHIRFADKRVRGEWFALDAADVAYIRSIFFFNGDEFRTLSEPATYVWSLLRPKFTLKDCRVDEFGFRLVDDLDIGYDLFKLPDTEFDWSLYQGAIDELKEVGLIQRSVSYYCGDVGTLRDQEMLRKHRETANHE